MEGALDPVGSSALARLHRVIVEGPEAVSKFLRRVESQSGKLSSGINRRNDSRTARIVDVEASSFTLLFDNLNDERLPQLFLSC